MNAGSHLSFYALDRVRLGEPVHAKERQHLGMCANCATYVGSAAAEGTTPLPTWLTNNRIATAPAPQKRWRAFWRVWTLGGTALALAAGLVLIWPRVIPEDDTPEIREKGSPAVQVFVKRAERVFPLNGRAIRPGDRLRVEVNGGGFGFVSVAGHARSEGNPVVLYEGALAAGVQLLPLSFRVDAEAGPEIVSVIFGQRPVSRELHIRAQETTRDDASTWRQILVIDKEIP